MCSDDCIGYILFRSQYRASGMPPELQRATLAAMETGENAEYHTACRAVRGFSDKVVDLVQAGEGLYLYSRSTPQNPLGCGTGKTHSAAAIANELIYQATWTAIHDPLVCWASVPEWLEALRMSFEGKEVPSHLAPERMKEVPLLVLDDLGAEKPSEWAQERVYTVVNRRDAEGLSTVVTTNYTFDQLVDRVGPRIASRMHCLTAVDMTSADHRR